MKKKSNNKKKKKEKEKEKEKLGLRGLWGLGGRQSMGFQNQGFAMSEERAKLSGTLSDTPQRKIQGRE